MDKLINSKFSNTEVTNNVENVGLGECMTPLNSQNQFSKVCIDWFQCTVPMPRNFLSKVQDYDYSKLDYDEVKKIDKFELLRNDSSQNFLLMLKYLNLDLNDALEHCGFFGYKKGLRWPFQNIAGTKETEGTLFLYDGGDNTNNLKGESTGLFQLSGNACRDFERRFGEKAIDSWKRLFSDYIFNYSAKATRIDIAIDIFDSELTLDWIKDKLDNQLWTGPFHNYSINYEVDSLTLEKKKYIILLGTFNSNCFCEIYDKKLERESKDLYTDKKSWIRFEFRFKQDKAQNMLLNMLENWDSDEQLIKYLIGFMENFIQFRINPDKGKYSKLPFTKSIKKHTRSNWDLDPLWTSITSECGSAVFTNYYKFEQNITRKANYVRRSVAKILSTLYFGNPIYFDLFIREGIIKGLEKLNKNDLRIINEKRKKLGLEELKEESSEIMNFESEYLRLETEFMNEYEKSLNDFDSEKGKY